MIHIGILGIGTAGTRHLNAFRRLPGVRLTVCDIDPGRRQHGAECGAATAASVDELLDQAPDGIVVALPHQHLAAAGMAVLDRGSHVLLEKPMATRLSDAVKVVDRARERGRVLMVSFVHRFRPDVARAHALIQAGVIGRPILIIDVMTSGRGTMPPWVWDRAQAGGGMMLYNGIHQIDRAHFLLGARVTAVKAEIRTLVYPVETEDTAVIALTYDSGALGTIVQHKASTQIQSAWETQVFGTEGSLAIRTGESMTWTAAGSTQSEPSSSEDRFLGAATEFVSAIREERPASPSGEDGLAALQVVLGAYEAGQKASPLTAIHYGSRP